MDVAVDTTWQHEPCTGIDLAGATTPDRRPNGSNAAVFDRDVPLSLPILIDDTGVADNQIIV